MGGWVGHEMETFCQKADFLISILFSVACRLSGQI